MNFGDFEIGFDFDVLAEFSKSKFCFELNDSNFPLSSQLGYLEQSEFSVDFSVDCAKQIIGDSFLKIEVFLSEIMKFSQKCIGQKEFGQIASYVNGPPLKIRKTHALLCRG